MKDNSIFIPTQCLNCNNLTNVDFHITKNNNLTIVQGRVLSPEGTPMANVGIEIIQINKINNTCKTIGCVFTDNCGKYGFTLRKDNTYVYELKIYAPLITC